jgi:eukaryotic-like serine/threonine-protein kinase
LDAGFMGRPTERVKALTGRFGSVELVELIGVGGMAVVYSAKHIKSGGKFAVKVLDKENASGNQIDRFIREARIGSLIEHKSCISVYESGEKSGYRYMTMDLIDGGDLKEKLKAEGARLPWEKTAAIAAAIAEALAYSHSKQIVHRDVKPANIFMTKAGKVCLGDFGLALILGEGPHREEDGRTGISIIVGTPAYMAPEQFRRPNGVDRRVDLYSLGVIIYELLCGERPFVGDSVKILQKEHERREPPALKNKVKGIPPLLNELVERLLAKKPDWRYESADAVANDLRGIVAGTLKVLTDDEIPSRSESAEFVHPQSKQKSRIIAAPAQNKASDNDLKQKLKNAGVFKIAAVTLVVCAMGFGMLFLMSPPSKEHRYQNLCDQAKIALEAKDFSKAYELYFKASRIFPKGEEAIHGFQAVTDARQNFERDN